MLPVLVYILQSVHGPESWVMHYLFFNRILLNRVLPYLI